LFSCFRRIKNKSPDAFGESIQETCKKKKVKKLQIQFYIIPVMKKINKKKEAIIHLEIGQKKKSNFTRGKFFFVVFPFFCWPENVLSLAARNTLCTTYKVSSHPPITKIIEKKK
jgi:hypothetical protein